MKLYHFTAPVNVLSIYQEGLQATASKKHGSMSGGIPVVWLTSRDSNIVTHDDKLDLDKLRIFGWDVGDFLFGGVARLEVNLRPQKRLLDYKSFLEANRAKINIQRSRLIPTAMSDWYVFVGDIPPSKISKPRARTALECLDALLARKLEKEVRADLISARRQMRAVPPEAVVDLKWK